MTKNPNAILRSIRSSVAMLSQGSPATIPPPVHDLIQAIKDLDNHLSWGGTPPEEWRGAPFPGPAAGTPQGRPRQAPTRPIRPPEPDPVQDIIRRM